MSTLNNNVSQTLEDFDSIRDAIVEKGVEVLESTLAAEYVNKICQIASGGTSDYADLDNKPRINDIKLGGNKTSSRFAMQIYR